MTLRFMPPESVMILSVLLVPQGELLEHFLDVAGVSAFAEQSSAEVACGPDGLEHVGRELLRNKPDQGPGRPVVRDDVVTVGQHDALGSD